MRGRCRHQAGSDVACRSGNLSKRYPSVIILEFYAIDACGKADLRLKSRVAELIEESSKRAAVAGDKIFEADFTLWGAEHGEIFLGGIGTEGRDMAFADLKPKFLKNTSAAVGVKNGAIGRSGGVKNAVHGE